MFTLAFILELYKSYTMSLSERRLIDFTSDAVESKPVEVLLYNLGDSVNLEVI